MKEDLNVSRLTAAKYLNTRAGAGIMVKRRIGRSNYYINPTLYSVLTGDSPKSQVKHEAPAAHPIGERRHPVRVVEGDRGGGGAIGGALRRDVRRPVRNPRALPNG